MCECVCEKLRVVCVLVQANMMCALVLAPLSTLDSCYTVSFDTPCIGLSLIHTHFLFLFLPLHLHPFRFSVAFYEASNSHSHLSVCVFFFSIFIPTHNTIPGFRSRSFQFSFIVRSLFFHASFFPFTSIHTHMHKPFILLRVRFRFIIPMCVSIWWCW